MAPVARLKTSSSVGVRDPLEDTRHHLALFAFLAWAAGSAISGLGVGILGQTAAILGVGRAIVPRLQQRFRESGRVPGDPAPWGRRHPRRDASHPYPTSSTSGVRW
jgi:hypothetical protein